MDQPVKEFCPHGGLHEPGTESPATLAGRMDGKGPGRLRIASLAASALWGLYAIHAFLAGRLDPMVGALAATVAVASLGVAWLSSPRTSEKTLRTVGSVYLLGTTFGMAMVEQHLGMAAGIGAGISWSAIWVAFFPIVLPCSPSHTLVKALVGATMTPVALGLAIALGRPVPAALDVVAMLAPVYIGAFVAYAGAKVLDRLGGRVEAMAAIGRYELVEKLGEGGMGDVWAARHRLLARPVALKLVKLSGEEDGVQLARFSREARVTASLESPHTVHLYDFGAANDGRLFYAMELLEGMDLEQLVKTFGKLPPERVVHILRQALHSLEEAHARDLVHRDIKPANLHIGRYALSHDHVKVLDFGLAKASSGGASTLITGNGRISGTPAYMAPEIVHGKAVDGRADVYALGCVAIYLLTGERVFPEATEVLAAAVAHVTETPVGIRARGVAIDEDLERVLMSTLEKDPVRRPDAASLREMLASVSTDAWTERDAADWWARNAPLPRRRVSEPPAGEVHATAPTLPRAQVLVAGHA
ncbi:MAG: serine/threonine protein kinase [Sandaracinaceae bacterium]|nr:serine/threonine protein kinase [Sandaracinaceae bacterium]